MVRTRLVIHLILWPANLVLIDNKFIMICLELIASWDVGSPWLTISCENHWYWTRWERLSLAWKHWCEVHSLLGFTLSILILIMSSLRTKVLMRVLTISWACTVEVNSCSECLYISVLDVATLMEESITLASLVWCCLIWCSKMRWNTKWHNVCRHLGLISRIIGIE